MKVNTYQGIITIDDAIVTYDLSNQVDYTTLMIREGDEVKAVLTKDDADIVIKLLEVQQAQIDSLSNQVDGTDDIIAKMQEKIDKAKAALIAIKEYKLEEDNLCVGQLVNKHIDITLAVLGGKDD